MVAKKSTQNKVKKEVIPNGIYGYKIFDENWQCQGFQYKIGETYEMSKDQVKICKSGFHFCRKCADCFNYNEFNPKNKIAEVLVETIIEEQEDKCVTNKITLVREISWEEMLKLCNQGQGNTGRNNSGDNNSGHRNSGNRNSGNRNSGHSNSGYYNSGGFNSGDCNSGDFNSGYRNSGDYNSGDYNSGNHNSGHFNTITPSEILVFNKLCKREDWECADKPSFFYNLDLTKWIQKDQMTEQELSEHPEQKTLDGYLKTTPYKQAWQEAWKTATEEDKRRLKALPNFDPQIFEEITGIHVE